MNAPQLIDLLNKKWKSFYDSSYFLIVLGLLVFGLFFAKAMFVYVEPNQMAVKQVKLGFNKGIQDKVYSTGLHFKIPGIELFHIYPKDLQVFDLASSRNQASSRYIDKSAYIQTSDGYFVTVDASIIFRIEDPLKVIKTIGLGELYFIEGLLPKAEPALKETLGELTAEEFYNPFLRVEKMKEAKDMINKELAEKGLTVDHVLIRYFKYPLEFQRNIEEKKLKDQLKYKNIAEANAATQSAQVQKVIKEGEATVGVELEKGNAYRVLKKAEQELYVRTQRAKGDLLVKTAEATKAKLKNNALKGVGAENLVGLEMAKVLEGVEIIVLPSDGEYGVNPLNLEQTRMMFD